MDLTLGPGDGVVLTGEPLSGHTTWRIGGPARAYCRVLTERGLSAVLTAAAQAREPLALLGMGSNILVSDEGFPGFVVRLEGEFLAVAIEGTRVKAGGGAALGGVCAAAARAGLSGLEAISGIPSSIGGAVRINAGAYGGEIFQVLESVRLVSREGKARTVAAADIGHGYRTSGLIATQGDRRVGRPGAHARAARADRGKDPGGCREAPGGVAVRAQRRQRFQATPRETTRAG